MALAAVVVAAIDDYARWEACLLQRCRRLGYVGRGIVRPRVAAAKHDVAIRIARGPYDGHSAGPVDAQETVWSRRRDERVHGAPEPAVRSVLVAHRHREAARHLAVRL